MKDFIKLVCKGICVILPVLIVCIYTYLTQARRVAFGEQAVVAYLYARESEFTAIRTILSGRMAGLEADTIRERLREAYV